MELTTILARIAAVIIFAWTARSAYRHFRDSKNRKTPASSTGTEKFLNGAIYYLWLAFMTTFSMGMFFNN